MAQAFPKSEFLGIDYHESAIAVARERAKQAGVADQIRFEVATPRALASGNEKFDLVCFMDSLHDMGDRWKLSGLPGRPCPRGRTHGGGTVRKGPV
jgi:2-polyprenyl-3-methyl-5-hydroxy-6-metoxy-1,4-benzoquinol methylase